MSTRLRFVALAAALVLGPWLRPVHAAAARVLFVSDDDTDLSIPGVLMGDGHDVVEVDVDFVAGRNASFHADLSGYDCIVWSATNDGIGSPHEDSLAFAALHDFVASGGSVLVTGYGSVGSGDAQLVAFLGGTGGRYSTGAPTAIADLDTDLTTGALDLRGVVPTNYAFSSYEGLTDVGSDTTVLVTGSSSPDAAQWSIRDIGSGHVAWIAGVDGDDSLWTVAGGGGDGAYNAALRNFVAASAGTASAPGAPRVAFTSPYTAIEGAPITVMARITDPEGDTLTFSWDLDGDGVFGEAMGETMVEVAAGVTDGPSEFVVAVEASDGTHTTHRARSITIANAMPTITSRPPTQVAIGLHVRYLLEVEDPGGAHDPLAFSLRTGPETAIVTPEGIFDWTPTAAEITAAGTTRTVAIDVDDGDGGIATQTWETSVLADHAPSDPTPLYPAMDAALLVPGIHVAVGNASDLDGDPITYTFELDTAPSFDSADLQSSPVTPADPRGITEWAPDESSLRFGRWYWRVTASDGRVSTFPVGASFLLVPDPADFPDLGTPDAGPDAGAPPPSPRGCGCSTARDRGIGGGSALIALGLATARRRRRARR